MQFSQPQNQTTRSLGPESFNSFESNNQEVGMKKAKKQVFIHRIKGIIFSPSKTFKKIIKNGSLNQAFGIVLTVALLSTIFSFGLYLLGLQDMDVLITDLKLNIRYIVRWFIVSGLIAFIGGVFFKGKGHFEDILTVTGFAQIPSVIMHLIMIMLLIPVGMVSFLVYDKSILELIIGIPMILLYLISLVWTIVLVVMGIRAAHRFDSYWRAILTVFTPLFVIVLLFGIRALS